MASGKNRILNSFVWKFLEQISIQITGIIFQIILARLLDPKDFGNLAILITFTNFALIFIQSGISVALIQKKELERYDIFSVLLLCLFIAAVFYVIIFFTAPVISNFYEDQSLVFPLRILAIVLFVGAINSVQTAILTRNFKFKVMFICNLIASLVTGAIGVVMAVYNLGIWSLVAHTLLSKVLVTFLMAFFIREKIHVGVSAKSIKNIYSFSIKILFANLISSAYDSLRTLVVGKKYSKEQLAYYDKAYTYSSYISQVSSNSLAGVLLPTFSEKQNNLDELKALARKSVKLTSFLMFPVFFGVACIAKSLIYVLLTEKWAACIPFLVIFCFLRIPGCITQIDKQVLYSLKKGGICLAYECVLLVVNVISIFVAINFGMITVAICSMCVEIMGCFVFFIISARVYSYSLKERLQDLYRPFLNAVIMSAAIYSLNLLPINDIAILVLQIFVGIALYTVLAFLIDRKTFTYLKDTLVNAFKKKKPNDEETQPENDCGNNKDKINTDDFNYNYVIFNYYDNPYHKDENGYYSICLEELKKLDNIQVVSFPLDNKNSFLRFLYRCHHSYKVNKLIKLPFKRIWYPLYFNKKAFNNDKPMCFIAIGPYITIDYIKYLKKKYNNAKFVKLHRDLVRVYQKGSPEWTEEQLRIYYDLWMSYDKNEAEEKNMIHFDEFESKIDVPLSDNYPLSDLFFAGAAKNRLAEIMSVYDFFENNGMKCDFYIVGVPKNEQVEKNGIVYGDNFLPYRELLYRTVNSKCVLEINQKGAVGYTARFLEAVMYNKKLITNNTSIKSSKFYNQDYIECINSADDIKLEFIQNEIEVDYGYNGEFSPVLLLKQIEMELKKSKENNYGE